MSTRKIILVVVALALLVLLFLAFQNRTGVSATPGGSALPGLPQQATDIRWFFPGVFGPSTYYEFNISRQGFQTWVENHSSRPLTGPHRGPFEVPVYDHDAAQSAKLMIDDAIAYTWRHEDQGVSIVYDVDAGRAYYYAHSR